MESIKELRNICQKPVVAENGWYVRFFVRKVSIHFTWIFLNTPITANQISFLMILLGTIGGFSFILRGYTGALIGTILLQLYLILDCADGEVARYKSQCSLKGKYLDYIANDIVHVALFAGLTIRTLNSSCEAFNTFSSHDSVIAVCGVSAITFPLLYKIVVYYVKEIRGEFILLSDSALKNEKCAPLKSFLRSILHPINVINIACICALLDLLPFILIGYGVIFPLSWILSIIFRFKDI